MRKLLYLLPMFIFMIGCSSDDSPTATANPNPNAKNEKIDWVSGNAVDYGMYFPTDFLALYTDNDFVSLEAELKITPKPGYENIPYSIFLINYESQMAGEEVYRENATGQATKTITLSTNGQYSFNIYMSDELKYDAELILKPQGSVGPLPQKTAIGQNR